jgi:hypothetical protein
MSIVPIMGAFQWSGAKFYPARVRRRVRHSCQHLRTESSTRIIAETPYIKSETRCLDCGEILQKIEEPIPVE